MKINAFKGFYKKGIWNQDNLQYFLNKNVITQEEYDQIIKQPREGIDLRVSNEPYYYEIWDRKSPINGRPAEEYLNDPFFKDTAVILVKDPNAKNKEKDVVYVESSDQLRMNSRLRTTLTDDEVGDYYVEYLENLRNAPQVSYEEVNAGMEIYTRVVQTDQLSEIRDLLIDIKQLLSEGR